MRKKKEILKSENKIIIIMITLRVTKKTIFKLARYTICENVNWNSKKTFRYAEFVINNFMYVRYLFKSIEKKNLKSFIIITL